MNFIMVDDGVQFITDSGKSYSIDRGHVNYDKVLDSIKNQDLTETKLEELLNVVESVKTWSNKELEITNDQILYNGSPVHLTVVDKILDLMSQGFPCTGLTNFLSRLMKNPSYNSRQQLYTFLEANHVPISEDGYIMGWKQVRSNYYDLHSNTFDNSPGNTIEMPREEVDDNPNNACSSGLHFGSPSYFSGVAGQNKVVVVKVDPADVVSVPTDHQCAKCRCCRYTVVCDYNGTFEMSSYVSQDNPYQEEDEDKEEIYYCSACPNVVDYPDELCSDCDDDDWP